MRNIDILLQILTLAREIGNETLAKEAVIAIAREYDIVPPTRYKSIQDIPLFTFPLSGNRIASIKELRERAMENGMSCGLKEAKEEIDRRIDRDYKERYRQY